MDRVRRLAMSMLQKNPTLFTSDFAKNKEVVTKVAIIRSKQLRNELAGYITALVKESVEEKKEEVSPELVVPQSETETS